MSELKIRRALLSVSDKQDVAQLAQSLYETGTEIIATGRTAEVIKKAGVPVTPIEKISGSPEAFQGRMKTLSFKVCSGILYRRDDQSDLRDLDTLGVKPIDCVVVNFYPFEEASKKPGVSEDELVEQIDIGGPTLVRAAAKNKKDVLVLTSPKQYTQIISELKGKQAVSLETRVKCAKEAWSHVKAYDDAIELQLGNPKIEMRYGENPHQKAWMRIENDSPIAWPKDGICETGQSLSYNNVLDLTSAYGLARDLHMINENSTGVVVVKHNNPCGVAMVDSSEPEAQLRALTRAWEGDPVSAFGGVLVFTKAIEPETARWLSERFIECVAAPELDASSDSLKILMEKRKKLKSVKVLKWSDRPTHLSVNVPGAQLIQAADAGIESEFDCQTKAKWPAEKKELTQFGISVCRSLKSNAIALVREFRDDLGKTYQLIGAGQGQPNRIDALQILAVPRAMAVTRQSNVEITPDMPLSDAVLVSDAFFPFRDAVDAAAQAGVRYIVQPGGSIKDKESVQACDEHGIAMIFTGVRHFKH